MRTLHPELSFPCIKGRGGKMDGAPLQHLEALADIGARRAAGHLPPRHPHLTPLLFCTVPGAGEYIILGNLGKLGSSMSTSDEKRTGSGEIPLYIYTMASKWVCSPVPPRCTNEASCVHLWFVLALLVWAIDLFSLSCC